MDLEEKIEHARVGGLVGQGTGCVAGRGPGQFPQQLCDAPGIIEAGPSGGVAVQQGPDRVVGTRAVQFLQQPGDAPRAVEADVGGGVAVQQGPDRDPAGRGPGQFP